MTRDEVRQKVGAIAFEAVGALPHGTVIGSERMESLRAATRLSADLVINQVCREAALPDVVPFRKRRR